MNKITFKIIIIISGIFLVSCGCMLDNNTNTYNMCSTYLYSIADMNEPLSDMGLSFVLFCKPKLKTMEGTGRYGLAIHGCFRKKDDPPHRLFIGPYSLNQLPTEAFLYRESTDCRHVTFWSTEDNEYFVLISGGCEVPVDKLFGPFVNQGKWKFIKTSEIRLD
jgi:hypothetical protein